MNEISWGENAGWSWLIERERDEESSPFRGSMNYKCGWNSHYECIKSSLQYFPSFPRPPFHVNEWGQLNVIHSLHMTCAVHSISHGDGKKKGKGRVKREKNAKNLRFLFFTQMYYHRYRQRHVATNGAFLYVNMSKNTHLHASHSIDHRLVLWIPSNNKYWSYYCCFHFLFFYYFFSPNKKKRKKVLLGFIKIKNFPLLLWTFFLRCVFSEAEMSLEGRIRLLLIFFVCSAMHSKGGLSHGFIYWYLI